MSPKKSEKSEESVAKEHDQIPSMNEPESMDLIESTPELEIPSPTKRAALKSPRKSQAKPPELQGKNSPSIVRKPEARTSLKFSAFPKPGAGSENNSFTALEAGGRRGSLPSSRGALLLQMSKKSSAKSENDLVNSSPPPTAKNGNAQGSPSLLLMSPRTVTDANGYDPELTPKAGRVRQPWQKFVPSPSSASPSGSILKRAGSLPTLIADTPGSSGGKRRVKFSDPPVSEQVEIPRLFLQQRRTTTPSASRLLQRLETAKSIPNFPVVTQEVSKEVSPVETNDEEESASLGTYTESQQWDAATPVNALPELQASKEPVNNIMNNLTSKTLYKVAEKSLKDSGVATVGDLCKLTELQASMLKGIKPPNNVQTIRDALKKFEKVLTKRVKIEQANSALHESDDRLKNDVISFARPSSGLAIADMPPSLDSLIEPTTPDEDDKAIKELYERPSPSPTEDIEASVEPEEPATQPLLTDVTQAEPVTALDKLEVKVTEPSSVSCQDTTKEALVQGSPKQLPMVEIPRDAFTDMEIDSSEAKEEEHEDSADSTVQEKVSVELIEDSTKPKEASDNKDSEEAKDDSAKSNAEALEVEKENSSCDEEQLCGSNQPEVVSMEDKYKELVEMLPSLDTKSLADLIQKAGALLAQKL